MPAVSAESNVMPLRAALLCSLLSMLAACDEGGRFIPSAWFPKTADSGNLQARGESSDAAVEGDVGAPDVFATSEAGLWDGRPSLGGVWVAHPDVDEPERVLVRNTTNGQSVVGALFRRERETPGPRLQVSSDAAQALGLLAGTPAVLEVTALRRQAAAASAPEADNPAEDGAEPRSADASVTAVVDTPAQPYLQAGIFSAEENAARAVDLLAKEGVTGLVRQSRSSGRQMWRVIVGPAATPAERDATLEKVRVAGFYDAYPVPD